MHAHTPQTGFNWKNALREATAAQLALLAVLLCGLLVVSTGMGFIPIPRTPSPA